jgi:hypothetical protein
MTPEEAEDETGRRTGAEVDPFAAARAGFADLVQALAAPAAGDLSHDRLEELIETRGPAVLQHLVHAVEDLQAACGEPGLAARSEPGSGPREAEPDDTGFDDAGRD